MSEDGMTETGLWQCVAACVLRTTLSKITQHEAQNAELLPTPQTAEPARGLAPSGSLKVRESLVLCASQEQACPHTFTTDRLTAWPCAGCVTGSSTKVHERGQVLRSACLTHGTGGAEQPRCDHDPGVPPHLQAGG